MTKSNKRPSLLRLFRSKQKIDEHWKRHHQMQKEHYELLRSYGNSRKQLITVDGKVYRIAVEIPSGIWNDPRLEVEYIGESTEIQKLVTNDLA